MAAEEFLPPGKLRIVPAAQLTRGRVRRGHQPAARTDFHVCNATSCPVPSSGRGKRGLHKLPRVSSPTPRVQSTNDRFRGGAIDGAFPFRVGVVHLCSCGTVNGRTPLLGENVKGASDAGVSSLKLFV